MSALNNDRIRATQSRRSNGPVSNSRTDFNHSHDQSEYEIVVQFELRRQKQKTRILEQRLANKQAFIQQMKQYQEQLTFAFEKCQEELLAAKKALELLTIAERNYIEEIADLKHLVIRLEDEISLRDQHNSPRARNYNSATKHSRDAPPREARAKTLMNEEPDSLQMSKSEAQDYVLKDSRKVSKFISQFVMMCECFRRQESEPLKSRLKAAWRWVKQVVQQWSSFRQQMHSCRKNIHKALQSGQLRDLTPEQLVQHVLGYLPKL